MCTSIALPLPDGHQLFGRTLDWHEHFDERVICTPRGFDFAFGRPRSGMAESLPLVNQYALIGMATEADGYPLYAEAMNECGLCMAGLRFAKGAHYVPATAEPPVDVHGRVIGLAPWEMIPYVLGLCATTEAAREALSGVRVIDLPFRLMSGESIPNSPLHWHIADGTSDGGSLIVEMTAVGLRVYDAPLGVMANDPPYPEQLAHYEMRMADGTVPQDYSSPERFVRAICKRDELAADLRTWTEGHECDAVSSFFALTDTVAPPKGTVPSVSGDGWQTTLYACCMDPRTGMYHYRMEGDPFVYTETWPTAIVGEST